LPCLALAEDLVDNPSYKDWSKWGEGASATLKTESAKSGKTITLSSQKQVLKKLTEEKAVVETSSEITVLGQTTKTNPVSMEIPARLPKVKADPNSAAAKKPKQGNEKLTINGKELDCEWYEYELPRGGSSKVWLSNDVPGKTVKSVLTSG